MRQPPKVALAAAPLRALEAPAGAGILAPPRSIRAKYVDGTLARDWPVSTARAGYTKPNGRFRVQRLERVWRSHRDNGARMPYGLFFRGPYAIRGTREIGRLGRRASAGRVRLSPAHARALLALTARHGCARVSIVP